MDRLCDASDSGRGSGAAAGRQCPSAPLGPPRHPAPGRPLLAAEAAAVAPTALRRRQRPDDGGAAAAFDRTSGEVIYPRLIASTRATWMAARPLPSSI